MASPREEILKRIERKRAEIAALEVQIRESNSYIQGLEEALKFLPKEQTPNQSEVSPQTLRAGSVVAKTREGILAHGRPLHITEILKFLGKPTDNATRAAVSGSISAYVRRGEIFTRPAPNTFGLLELPEGVSKSHSTQNPNQPSPPPEFGTETDTSNEEAEDDPFAGMEAETDDENIPF